MIPNLEFEIWTDEIPHLDRACSCLVAAFIYFQEALDYSSYLQDRAVPHVVRVPFGSGNRRPMYEFRDGAKRYFHPEVSR